MRHETKNPAQGRGGSRFSFGDYVFNTTWDVMSDLTKSRQHGFHDVVDSEDMFVDLLTRFREARIVP